MKINDSAVTMQSSHSYSHFQEAQVSSVLIRPSVLAAVNGEEDSATVSISDKSQSLFEKLKAKQEELQKEQQEKVKENLKGLTEKSQGASGVEESVGKLSSKDEQMLKTLKRILEMLRSMKRGRAWSSDGLEKHIRESITELESRAEVRQTTPAPIGRGFSQGGNVVDLRSSASISAGTGTTWVRHTEKSGFVMEQESTSFSATGLVHTADGREISFGVDLSMSRAFYGEFFESSDVAQVLTDPLVINLDNNNASVSDQKFHFDLDSDGKEEEISSLGRGSGFLAYDKNGDGVINDGSELFGTKSGNGFADLAAYDEDGNGWIDENDSIYDKLKVWTKNEDGTDRLLNLKEADVGAIYLGNADTEFSLKDGANNTNAVIRKTGVFLKESGGVGTVQHLDLAV